jgi:diguanylate cyclase (GGDEF)-like protein
MSSLLLRMLQPDPAVRPSAADVLEILLDHGGQVAGVDPAMVRRRARVCDVVLPGLQDQIDQWKASGGALTLVGSRGAGRVHVLRQISWQLAADGRQALTLHPSDVAWGSVEGALAELGCSLPVAADPISRIDELVDLFRARDVVVLVEHLGDCDAASQRLVEALAASDLPVCVTVSADRADLPGVVALPPLDRATLGAVLQRLLGDGADQDTVCMPILEVSGGLPGAVVELVCSALECGALVRSLRSWTWVAERAPTASDVGGSIDLRGLPELAVQVGGIVALQPRGVDLGVLGTLSRCAAGDLDALLDELALRRLVTVFEQRVEVTPSCRAALLETLDDPVRWRRELVAAQSHLHGVSVELSHHALALDDASLLAQYAASGVTALTARDPVAAARLAERAWTRIQAPDLALARIEAMRAAGWVEEAATFGAEALPGLAGARRVAMCVALGSLEADDRQRPEVGRTWAGLARDALWSRPAPPALLVLEGSIAHSLHDHDAAIATLAPVLSEPIEQLEEAQQTLWLRAAVLRSQCLNSLGRPDEAIAQIEAVPAACGADTAPRARLYAALGRLYWLRGRFSEADAAMSSAAERGSGLSAADRARLLNNIGAARYHLGRRRAAVTAWEQALGLFERIGAVREVGRCWVNLSVGYMDSGQWERADRATKESLKRTADGRAPDLQAHAMINAGRLALSRGRLVEAEGRFLQAVGVAGAAGLERERVEALVRLAEHAVETRRADARGAVDRAIEAAEAASLSIDLAEVRVLALVLDAREGATEEALEAGAEAAIGPLREAGAAAAIAELRVWLATAFCDAGLPDASQSRLDQARSYAQESGAVPLLERIAALQQRLDEERSAKTADDGLMRMVSLAVDINECEELDPLLLRIAEAGRELLGGDRSFVLDRSGAVVAATDDTEVGVPPSSFVVNQVLSTHREVIAADVGERGDLREQRSVALMSLRSVYCAPLLFRETLLGVLYVDSREVRHKDVWKGVQLIQGLAALAAVAIRRTQLKEEQVQQAAEAARLTERAAAADSLAAANERLSKVNEKLRRASIIDPLTQLYNRRHLTAVLSDLDAILNRSGRAYGLIILDIDHFKNINDTWGHPVGDAVLRWVAGLLTDVVREEDRAFRFGGEEMVVLVDDASPEGVFALAERLRADLCRAPFVTDDDAVVAVSASLGVAMAEVAGEGWEDVLRRSDAALYRSKEEGRNRTTVAEPALRPGHGAVA